jgi:hypothetical protein
MTQIIGVMIACLIILLSTSTMAVGDTWNKKTVLTVQETIQVPGALLPPGKYVVKLLDSFSTRHVVCITNESENEVLTTMLAIPNYRLKPTGNTEFAWWETPAGTPRALRAWFYPGDNFGQEFAYPKQTSTKIAEAAHAPVLTAEAKTPAEIKEAPITVVEKGGEAKPLPVQAYAAPAPKPAPEPAPVEAAVQPVESPRAEPLPSTATPYPLIGLAGGIALIAGVGLRRLISTR